MLFGPRNGPETFWRTMDILLATVKWYFALIHLNDIVIFSKAPGEHTRHIREALTLRQNAGVTLELKKCYLFTKTIEHLGTVIRSKNLENTSHTTEEILGLEEPINFTGLRYFLGLCNVFWRFVQYFARLAAALNTKLRKYQSKGLGPSTEEELAVMNALKETLVSPPILALPNNTVHMTLDTDA